MSESDVALSELLFHSAALTENDIEMAIKAMTIYPIDKTVDALKIAVSKSEGKYNLDAALAQKAEPANEK